MVAVIDGSPVARTRGASRPSLVLIPGGQKSSPLRLLAPLDPAVSPLGTSVSLGAPGQVQQIRRVSPALAPASPIGMRLVSPPNRSILRHWRLLAGLMVALAVLTGGWLVVRAIGGLGGGGSLTSSGEPAVAAASGGAVATTTGAAGFPSVSGAGGQTSTGGAIADVRPTQGHTWVVRPGDTLWGIVQAAGVSGDPRPVVDKMAAALKGQPLQVGQLVVVP